MYVCIVCMLFPQTNSPPFEFDPCLGGSESLILVMVGWDGCGAEFESKCQVVPTKCPLLFEVCRRKLSIPEKTVYSVWKYWTLPVQIPHPTQASFKMPIPPRQGSNSPPPGLLCQIPYSPGTEDNQIPVGCLGGLGEGGGG